MNNMATGRRNGRAADELRPVRFTRGFTAHAEGSVLAEFGGTRVLCTASVEQGVPHYPRMAGRASGADPRVVARAVRDFWALRLRLWIDRDAALRRGRPVVPEAPYLPPAGPGAPGSAGGEP